MATELSTWALPRIERLLPLDSDSLQQIIDYAATLSKDATADHLKNLLGDSPQALEFISSFNSRRRDAPPQSASAGSSRPSSPPLPKARQRPPKKQKNIHSLPARQVEGHGDVSGAFVKRDEQDYMTTLRQRAKADSPTALSSQPAISPSHPPATSTVSTPRSSSPATAQPKAKVNIAGGQSMSGSSTLSDLDAAIRSLELQTNPTISSDPASRAFNCMATIHPLLAAAPNCLSCGQIICLKQGLGPCTSCGAPLLAPEDVASMLRLLKDERGRERQAEGNKAHRRAEIAAKPRAFSGRDFLSSKPTAPPLPSPLAADPAAAEAAQAHRDKLLNFQAQNARRTTVHDEAADFALPVLDASGSGYRAGNAWASPAERAMEIKRAQRALREFEFNSRPEWEKKKIVASIDVVKGKVVRRFVEQKYEEKEEPDEDVPEVVEEDRAGKAGAFSRNPLLGKMIRPVFAAQGDAKDRPTPASWRRVQDDIDDNEDVILDGGTRGFGKEVEV